ncbi:MAG: GNAT family N-acetyltransferase [Alphaproteobacteria bacterium]|nr:GNAT family N-acetyltransferase [Alphaproteobacteria bacterium]
MATGVIRPARPEDAERLIAVHRAAVLSIDPAGGPPAGGPPAGGHYNRAVLEGWASPATKESAETMARSIAEVAEHAFIAESSPATLGWFSLTPDGAHVRAFYVAPEFARRGVGQAMMAVAAAASRSLGNEVLSIHASLNAVSFYRGQGFIGEERVTVPLGGEIDIEAIAMTLVLPKTG